MGARSKMDITVSEWPAAEVSNLERFMRDKTHNLDLALAEFATSRKRPFHEVQYRWDQIQAEKGRSKVIDEKMEQELHRKVAEFQKTYQGRTMQGIRWETWEQTALSYFNKKHADLSAQKLATLIHNMLKHRSERSILERIYDLRSDNEAEVAEQQITPPVVLKAVPQGVSLPMPQPGPDGRYRVGEIIREAPVNGVKWFGFWVTLPNGDSALVHKSRMVDEFVTDPSLYVRTGDKIMVTISGYDSLGRCEASTKNLHNLTRKYPSLNLEQGEKGDEEFELVRPTFKLALPTGDDNVEYHRSVAKVATIKKNAAEVANNDRIMTSLDAIVELILTMVESGQQALLGLEKIKIGLEAADEESQRVRKLVEVLDSLKLR